MEWYQPQCDSERYHLQKNFDNIAMQGGEHPKLFFDPVEKKLNVLASLGILTSDREVVRLNTRRLASEVYDVNQRTTLLCPALPTHVEEVVRVSYANRKTNALEGWKLAAAPSVDPYAVAVGGGFHGNIGGRLFGGTMKQQPQQQQRQYGGAG